MAFFLVNIPCRCSFSALTVKYLISRIISIYASDSPGTFLRLTGVKTNGLMLLIVCNCMNCVCLHVQIRLVFTCSDYTNVYMFRLFQCLYVQIISTFTCT